MAVRWRFQFHRIGRGPPGRSRKRHRLLEKSLHRRRIDPRPGVMHTPGGEKHGELLKFIANDAAAVHIDEPGGERPPALQESREGFGVRLESVKVGGSTYTSVEALQRFADRLSEARPGNVPGSATLTRCRQKQIDDAAHEVERILGAGKARHSSA